MPGLVHLPALGSSFDFYYQRIYFYYINSVDLLKFGCYLHISKSQNITLISILSIYDILFGHSHVLGSTFNPNFKNDYIDPIPGVDQQFVSCLVFMVIYEKSM